MPDAVNFENLCVHKELMVALDHLSVRAKPCDSSHGCGKTLARSDSKSTVDTETPEDDVPREASPCEGRFVSAFGSVLVHLTRSAEIPDHRTTFDGVRVPTISLQTYLARLTKYFACSLECFVVAAVLLDRLVRQHSVLVTERNVHRLVGVCLLVAAKIQDDVYYSNTYYASVCGLSLLELNFLESELLRLLDWRVLVSPEEYETFRAAVLSTCGE